MISATTPRRNRRRLLLGILYTALAVVAATAAPAAKATFPTIQVWLTTADGSTNLAQQASITLGPGRPRIGPAGATGGNRRQMGRARKPLKQADPQPAMVRRGSTVRVRQPGERRPRCFDLMACAPELA